MIDCVDSLDLTIDSVCKPQHHDNYREIGDVDRVDFDDFDATGTAKKLRLRLMQVPQYITCRQPAADSLHSGEIPEVGEGRWSIGLTPSYLEQIDDDDELRRRRRATTTTIDDDGDDDRVDRKCHALGG